MSEALDCLILDGILGGATQSRTGLDGFAIRFNPLQTIGCTNAASDVDCIWVARTSQRNAIYTHRLRHWMQQGHPYSEETLNRGLFDMPMVWIDSLKAPNSPADLRIQSFLHAGAVWLTPEQFAGGLAKGAFHYAPGKFGSVEWRFDPAVAGIQPAGPLIRT